MHIIILNDNGVNPVFWGTNQECKDWLIGKARTFAGTDQHQYEQYVHSIADEGILVTENPYRNYKIQEV